VANLIFQYDSEGKTATILIGEAESLPEREGAYINIEGLNQAHLLLRRKCPQLN
jgi:hypothetical protein